MIPHKDWYEHIAAEETNKPNKKFVWPWKRQPQAPVTDNDRAWIERSLISIYNLFTPEYFQSFKTLGADSEFFHKKEFKTDKDADYLLHKIATVLGVETWEFSLMFFSNRPTDFSEGITATPSDQLNDRWKSESAKTIDHGLGNKEIWIELELLNDPQQLTSAIAYELTKYKLITDYQLKDNQMIAELTTIVFGFGIFLGNSYFKFSQWTGTSHYGWRMSKRGILPEQVIAYAMAWLAYFRKEDLTWQTHLNKTIKKYFEQSYKYISLHHKEVCWPAP